MTSKQASALLPGDRVSWGGDPEDVGTVIVISDHQRDGEPWTVGRIEISWDDGDQRTGALHPDDYARISRAED